MTDRRHVSAYNCSGQRGPCRAVLAGEEALARLHTAPLSCFANFQRSLYLENAAGELICLGQADLEPGPLTILCADWAAHRPEHWPQPADRLSLQQDNLCWARGRIALGGCPVWRPPLPPPCAAVSREALCAFFARRGCSAGLAPLCIPALQVSADVVPDVPAAPLLQAGARALAPFVRWLRNPVAPPDIQNLLGLGPGLTPSGDDVLGGALTALRLTARTEQAATLSAAIAALPGRTNRISEAHLGMAASGLGAQALHVFINTALAGLPLSDAVADGLDRIGHSSGWDMALGASLALVSGTGAPPARYMNTTSR